MILALLTTALAVAVGYNGAALYPDTFLYARRGLHLWPAPASNIGGLIGGHSGVIWLSAIAAGFLVYIVRRTSGTGAAFLFVAFVPLSRWLLFPGVDALGVVFYLAWRATGKGLWIVAALIHPVTLFATVATAAARAAHSNYESVFVFAACGFATLAVGLADTFSTTSRYLLPAWALIAMQVTRARRTYT